MRRIILILAALFLAGCGDHKQFVKNCADKYKRLPTNEANIEVMFQGPCPQLLRVQAQEFNRNAYMTDKGSGLGVCQMTFKSIENEFQMTRSEGAYVACLEGDIK